MYPFQPAFTPITPKELSVSDTTFKVLYSWKELNLLFILIRNVC